MDTDELLKQAYKAVIIESERFDHDLTLQFGLLAAHCSGENEYLEQSLSLIQELAEYSKNELSDIFFERIPDLTLFRKTLAIISNNIESVKRIPLKSRFFDEY